jgi:hypothetical protein
MFWLFTVDDLATFRYNLEKLDGLSDDVCHVVLLSEWGDR